ncbi:MAG TPA: type 4a pilus biogenesis protein PilO [Terriglobales bacterium]|nr:type 4a pilus biogenesis protein PilO [Terriglobales bacterium]
MNFNEMSGLKQWGVVLVAAMLLTVGLYFTYFKSQRDANTTAQVALEKKLTENRELEPYKTRLAEIDRQLASLQQQMEIEKRIVPDDKDVDGFIKMLDAEAAKVGVELRRYTAQPTSSREYYTEVPFEVELDGSYYSMMKFFDNVAKLERIVNVSNLLVANTKRGAEAKAKHVYQYAPGESVVATCVATTFFSHDTAPAAVPAGVKGRT